MSYFLTPFASQRDIKDKSPEYWKAVEALKALPWYFPAPLRVNHHSMVYAEATQEHWRAELTKMLKANPAGRGNRIARLIDRNGIKASDKYLRPPGDDHGTLFVRGKTVVAYISEPYQVSSSTAKKIVEFCELYQLEFEITSLSTWYPGQTLAVLYWRREDRV